jgi:CheY-like chemotaxis protein
MSAALNIVVIDDNSTNRLLPGLFLRPLGHAVNECVGAEEALEWLMHNPCDVILLDISMPSVSGLQLCKQLRADQRYQHLQIIAYTAHAMPDEVLLWESSGFDKVLLKPIRKDDLLALFS